MRWILVLALLLSGCTDEETAATAPVPEDISEVSTDLGGLPTWRPGQAWTYRTLGHWDAPEEITVVAVPQDEGHLMAAASEEQLVDEVAWDRLYFGPVAVDQTPLGGGNRLLQLPMENGTAWEIYGVTVVAREATISWAGGVGPGFRAAGASDGRDVLVEYVPDAGHVTLFSVRNGAGEVMEGIELISTSLASEWVYLERADELVLHDPVDGPGALRVVSEDDAVLAWAVGSDGGRAAVAAPGQPPVLLEGRGVPHFEARWLDPVEGEWHAAIVAPPDGDMYLQLHALRWIHGTIS